MRKKLLCILFVMTFSTMVTGPAGWSRAGQVVTERTSARAKSLLAQGTSPRTETGEVTIAVLPFRNLTQDPEIDPFQKGLPLLLIHDLSKIRPVRTIDRAGVQALMDQLGLEASSKIGPELAVRIGKLLGASYVVRGAITTGHITELKVNTDLLKVSNAMLVDQPVTAGDISALIGMQKEIVFDILNALEIRPTPQQRKFLETPATESEEALLLYFQGIDSADQGQYTEAANSFRRALREDPSFQMPAVALKELKDAKLLAVPTPAPQQKPAPKKQPPPPKSVKTAPVPKTAVTPKPPEAPKPVAAPTPVEKPNAVEEARKTEPPKPAPEADETKPETQAPPQVEDKKVPTALLVGGGVALLAVGIAAVAGGGGGGDAPPPEPGPAPEPEAPRVTETKPAEGSDIACETGSISFVFSKNMDTSSGSVQAQVTNAEFDWNISQASWQETTTFTVVYENTCPATGDAVSVTFSLDGFADTEGAALGGQSSFTFPSEL